MQGDAGFFSFGGQANHHHAWGCFGHETRKRSLSKPRRSMRTLITCLHQTMKYQHSWLPIPLSRIRSCTGSRKNSFLHLGRTIFEPEFAISPESNLAASLISKMIESTETEKTLEQRMLNGIQQTGSLPWLSLSHLPISPI